MINEFRNDQLMLASLVLGMMGAVETTKDIEILLGLT